MYALIEIELTRVRRMAEESGDEFLAYLIDLAIIEANTKARAASHSLETAITPEKLENSGFKPRVVA